MLVFPLVDIHAKCVGSPFAVIPFVRNPEGLSVTTGDFLTFAWEHFRADGFQIVRKCLRDYLTGYKPGSSQFDRMSKEERLQFYQDYKIGYQICQREPDLWWISLMEPVAGGAHMLPIGPKARAKFRPSQEGDRFFEVLLQLMPNE